MSTKDIICANLKALRESLELNQTAFAERCKLHQRTYGRVENGDSVASMEILEKVAQKNDLEVWQLFVSKFNPKNPPVLQIPSEAEEKFYKSSANSKKIDRRKNSPDVTYLEPAETIHGEIDAAQHSKNS